MVIKQCDCCGLDKTSTRDSRVLLYSKKSGTVYFPLCASCFDRESVSYNDLIYYYTKDIPTEIFDDESVEVLSLLKRETFFNDILKSKYESYLIEQRTEKINIILYNQ